MPKPPDNNASNEMAMTALAQAVDSLTEESSHEDRMAVALSLVSFGASIQKAAEESGLAPKTVWERVRRDSKSKSNEQQAYIEYRAQQITLKGLQRLEQLIDNPDSCRPAEAIKAIDTASRIAAQLGRWTVPEEVIIPVEIKKTPMQEFIEGILQAEKKIVVDSGTVRVIDKGDRE